MATVGRTVLNEDTDVGQMIQGKRVPLVYPRQVGTCRCGHERAAHLHFTAGTYCSLCHCPAYKSRRPLRDGWGRLMRVFGRRDG
jgi:hypothetical protein